MTNPPQKVREVCHERDNSSLLPYQKPKISGSKIDRRSDGSNSSMIPASNAARVVCHSKGSFLMIHIPAPASRALTAKNHHSGQESNSVIQRSPQKIPRAKRRIPERCSLSLAVINISGRGTFFHALSRRVFLTFRELRFCRIRCRAAALPE